jgi:hypothetical protein
MIFNTPLWKGFIEMGTDKAIGFIIILVTIVGINITIFWSSHEYHLHNPVRWVVLLNFLTGIIVAGFFYLLVNELAAIIIFFTSSLFLLAIVLSFLLKRDKKGIKTGEYLLNLLNYLDLEILYVEDCILENNNAEDVKQASQQAFLDILETTIKLLKIPENDGTHISLLRAQEGEFQLICQKGIANRRLPLIEKKFRYKDPVAGLAGKCASEKKIICINDFSDHQNPYSNDWLALEDTETKPGSIICTPLFWGVGKKDRILAVLSITSKRNNAFDERSFPNFLEYINSRLESLIYLVDIGNKLRTSTDNLPKNENPKLGYFGFIYNLLRRIAVFLFHNGTTKKIKDGLTLMNI